MFLSSVLKWPRNSYSVNLILFHVKILLLSLQIVICISCGLIMNIVICYFSSVCIAYLIVVVHKKLFPAFNWIEIYSPCFYAFQFFASHIQHIFYEHDGRRGYFLAKQYKQCCFTLATNTCLFVNNIYRKEKFVLKLNMKKGNISFLLILNILG